MTALPSSNATDGLAKPFYEYFCERLAAAYARNPYRRVRPKDVPKPWPFLSPMEQEAWQWYVDEFGGERSA